MSKNSCNLQKAHLFNEQNMPSQNPTASVSTPLRICHFDCEQISPKLNSSSAQHEEQSQMASYGLGRLLDGAEADDAGWGVTRDRKDNDKTLSLTRRHLFHQTPHMRFKCFKRATLRPLLQAAESQQRRMEDLVHWFAFSRRKDKNCCACKSATAQARRVQECSGAKLVKQLCVC